MGPALAGEFTMRIAAFCSLFLLFPSLAFAQDVDGDGVDAATDCDDLDPNNFPGNSEVCDGQDNDCNGLADFGGVGAGYVLTGGTIINNADFTKGNVFQASAGAVVSSWGMYLDVDPAATLTLTIGEGSSSSGPFTIVSTVPLGAVAAGAQTHMAGGLNVNLSSGMYYWFGATWSGGNGGNYYDNAGASSNPSWGSHVTGAWDGTAIAPTSGWSPASLPTGAYDMEIITGGGGVETDLDLDGWYDCEECDDTDPTVFPGAPDVCGDGVDSDCDGTVEIDADLDGFYACEDCDDTDATVNPAAVELCDGLDNDCNGLADFDVAGEVDLDGDGDLSCVDCDDLDYTAGPSRPERCDGIDNDCNGSADFGGPGGEDDADGDGYPACDDCDDTVFDTFPGAPEICDGLDNDCDGLANFNGPMGEVDEDLDGAFACEDCDDADDLIYPGAPELCDGQDNDCDGIDPSTEMDDADGDGYAACDGDCNDQNPAMFAGNVEVCDAIDNDCNGEIDESPDCTDDDGAVAPKLGGCGCETGSGASSAWLLLGILATRRRQ